MPAAAVARLLPLRGGGVVGRGERPLRLASSRGRRDCSRRGTGRGRGVGEASLQGARWAGGGGGRRGRGQRQRGETLVIGAVERQLAAADTGVLGYSIHAVGSDGDDDVGC